ncbi:MAG: UDP-2,4-diacetamido-2,4,6-trideoxy-beta-L-altropyranose hydrolase [Proteobacteria bacterium]|nr:UDP-2,4-diacetamido-2,4,6-trideoxy-beta-L-altropyranose hydrolase [Desulfobulbaceae bacterium]MBU4153808.1 UDP-2,4-diacetamido-2,4,6-trideoxy-beta-L-altropyranose hydrolase [Pseudomonadota bacterium]
MTSQPRLLVFRADADTRTGAGHIMRGLALAQEWQSHGGEVVFVGHISGAPLREWIKSEGFKLFAIDSPYPDLQDLTTFLPWLHERQGTPGWVVLDGYHFDTNYHQALRAAGWPLLIIDDYGNLPAYHADIIVNPNAYADKIHYHTQDQTLILGGARFAMLRKEFKQALDNKNPTANERVSQKKFHILVTMGGSDPDNITQKTIDAIHFMGRSDLAIKIIVGPLNPHRHSLESNLRNATSDAEILAPVTDMATLMRWADLAFSAAGSTCWELAALGVPVVTTILATNQERVATSLATRGVAVNLGWHHAWQVNHAAQILTNLLNDPQKRQSMRNKGQQLIDGQGCKRLTRSLQGYHFSLRRASENDCQLVFHWANDQITRSASFSPKPIPWQEHCRWFADQLADKDLLFYIAITPDKTPMAQARFNLTGHDKATISVSLAPEFRNSGLGTRLIRLTCNQAIKERNIRTIRALVKHDNPASLHAFASAGFHHRGTVEISGQHAVAMDYTLEGAA